MSTIAATASKSRGAAGAHSTGGGTEKRPGQALMGKWEACPGDSESS